MKDVSYCMSCHAGENELQECISYKRTCLMEGYVLMEWSYLSGGHVFWKTYFVGMTGPLQVCYG